MSGGWFGGAAGQDDTPSSALCASGAAQPTLSPWGRVRRRLLEPTSLMHGSLGSYVVLVRRQMHRCLNWWKAVVRHGKILRRARTALGSPTEPEPSPHNLPPLPAELSPPPPVPAEAPALPLDPPTSDDRHWPQSSSLRAVVDGCCEGSGRVPRARATQMAGLVAQVQPAAAEAVVQLPGAGSGVPAEVLVRHLLEAGRMGEMDQQQFDETVCLLEEQSSAAAEPPAQPAVSVPPGSAPVMPQPSPSGLAAQPQQPQLSQAFSCCRHGRRQQLVSWLEQGFDVNSVDDKGNSLLLVASQNGMRKICKVLLKARADLDHQNHLGNTAAHFAREYSFSAVLELLVQSKADLNVRNNRGLTPLEGLKPPPSAVSTTGQSNHTAEAPQAGRANASGSREPDDESTNQFEASNLQISQCCNTAFLTAVVDGCCEGSGRVPRARATQMAGLVAQVQPAAAEAVVQLPGAGSGVPAEVLVRHLLEAGRMGEMDQQQFDETVCLLEEQSSAAAEPPAQPTAGACGELSDEWLDESESTNEDLSGALRRSMLDQASPILEPIPEDSPVLEPLTVATDADSEPIQQVGAWVLAANNKIERARALKVRRIETSAVGDPGPEQGSRPEPESIQQEASNLEAMTHAPIADPTISQNHSLIFTMLQKPHSSRPVPRKRATQPATLSAPKPPPDMEWDEDQDGLTRMASRAQKIDPGLPETEPVEQSANGTLSNLWDNLDLSVGERDLAESAGSDQILGDTENDTVWTWEASTGEAGASSSAVKSVGGHLAVGAATIEDTIELDGIAEGNMISADGENATMCAWSDLDALEEDMPHLGHSNRCLEALLPLPPWRYRSATQQCSGATATRNTSRLQTESKLPEAESGTLGTLVVDLNIAETIQAAAVAAKQAAVDVIGRAVAHSRTPHTSAANSPDASSIDPDDVPGSCVDQGTGDYSTGTTERSAIKTIMADTRMGEYRLKLTTPEAVIQEVVLLMQIHCYTSSALLNKFIAPLEAWAEQRDAGDLTGQWLKDDLLRLKGCCRKLLKHRILVVKQIEQCTDKNGTVDLPPVFRQIALYSRACAHLLASSHTPQRTIMHESDDAIRSMLSRIKGNVGRSFGALLLDPLQGLVACKMLLARYIELTENDSAINQRYLCNLGGIIMLHRCCVALDAFEEQLNLVDVEHGHLRSLQQLRDRLHGLTINLCSEPQRRIIGSIEVPRDGHSDVVILLSDMALLVTKLPSEHELIISAPVEDVERKFSALATARSIPGVVTQQLQPDEKRRLLLLESPKTQPEEWQVNKELHYTQEFDPNDYERIVRSLGFDQFEHLDVKPAHSLSLNCRVPADLRVSSPDALAPDPTLAPEELKSPRLLHHDDQGGLCSVNISDSDIVLSPHGYEATTGAMHDLGVEFE